VGSISYLNPAMALFGLEPGVPSLHYLLVDNKGLPEGGPGVNNGYRARFITRCVNEPVGCRRTITLEAQEEARLLYMTIEIDHEISHERIASLVLSLRRTMPEERGATAAPPVRAQPLLPPTPGRRRR
jgi:hypothetical protein